MFQELIKIAEEVYRLDKELGIKMGKCLEGLGKKVVESIKNYAITNEYKILVSNVTNYIFWNKLGFKQTADDKMFVSFN